MSAVQEELSPRGPLPWERPLTVDDLETLPDDGHRYELLDGTLLVSPAPGPRHQRLVVALIVLLYTRVPAHLEVLTAPVGLQLAGDTELQPDVLVAARADVGERYLDKPPVLAVEVLSPSTRMIDLSLKKAAYERFGTPSYWVLDPNPDDPFVIVFELEDGVYRQIAHVRGEESVDIERPFPVRLRPSDLAAGIVPDQVG